MCDPSVSLRLTAPFTQGSPLIRHAFGVPPSPEGKATSGGGSLTLSRERVFGFFPEIGEKIPIFPIANRITPWYNTHDSKNVGRKRGARPSLSSYILTIVGIIPRCDAVCNRENRNFFAYFREKTKNPLPGEGKRTPAGGRLPLRGRWHAEGVTDEGAPLRKGSCQP